MTSSFRGGLLLLGLVLAAGCNKSEAATTQQRPSQVQGEGGGGSRVETDNYVAYLRAPGSYTKDAEGTIEVVLETRGDYHINEQYPYKFTPKPGDGVNYKGPTGREGGEFTVSKAVLKVPFTPTKSGPVVVGGKFSLSVCSDKNCLMEKKDLELSVSVK